MLVSFVVPVYNSAKHLTDCLESIRAQTDSDFEVVVVDDGSTDQSTEIVEKYCKIDKRFKTYKTSNMGPLLARRIGVENSSGEYILCLDSDDKFRPDTVSTLKKLINMTHPDIINFGMTYNDISWSVDYLTLDKGNYFNEQYSYIKQCVCGGESVNVCAKAIKKSLFDLEEDYAPYCGMRYAEDWFQLLPIIDRASSCCCIDEALYYYRQTPSSSMHTFRLNDLLDFEKCIDRLYSYQNKWGASYQTRCQRALIVHTYALLSRSILIGAKKEETEETIALIDRLNMKYSFLNLGGYRENKNVILAFKRLVLCSAIRKNQHLTYLLIKTHTLVSNIKQIIRRIIDRQKDENGIC